jgi:hypothetical protein
MPSAWFPMRTSLKELVNGRGAYRVADVFGHGGGLALGAVQAGFMLAARRDDGGGAGLGMLLANKATLGAKWNAQAAAIDKWRPVTADVVTGSPLPGSVSTLISYAARLKPAAVVLDFPAAVTADPDFGAGLLAGLTRLTRIRHQLTTIRYNDLSLGGAMDRARTFLVLSQIPIGVNRAELDWIPSSWDAVADLMDLELIWGPQAIERAPTWYSRSLRSPEHTVDGHAAAYDYRTVREWDWNRPGWMPSASGVNRIRGRDGHVLTHRETARLMGFPDSWAIGSVPRGMGGTYLGASWQETTSVHPARWLMEWVHSCLDGAVGPLTGEVDLTDDWRAVARRQWPEIG